MEYQLGHYSFVPAMPTSRNPHEQRGGQAMRRRGYKHADGCEGKVCVTCGKCQCRKNGTIYFERDGDMLCVCNDYCWVRRPKSSA